jgi:transposase, IS30 family
MKAQLTLDQRKKVRQLRAKGMALEDIVREMDTPLRTINRILARRGKREQRMAAWDPGPGRLSLREREEISIGLRKRRSYTSIAKAIGRSPSTVSREVHANGGRGRYRAWRAHDRAYVCARRPKEAKLECSSRLALQVTEWLEAWWSPEEISARLRLEYPDDPDMRVSHETIYQSIYVQGRGELRRELVRCLRSSRIRRKPRDRVDTKNRGRIPNMVKISERPAEVADRAVPGHWEGDLLIGKLGHSQVGTLVERTSGYVALVHLPDGRDALKLVAAMRQTVRRLPTGLVKTITWDQGREMARHAEFTVATGVQVYFCDPHSPWQRPSNENTNGLLRQYMPKGVDLSSLSRKDLDVIARSLNNRPRKRLGFMKPSERFAELVASTA